MFELPEILKKILSTRSERLQRDEVISFYRNERQDEVQKANDKAERLVSETESLVDDLEDSIQELKDFEHQKDIQAVEDVADNFYKSRRRMIRRFEPSENIEEHVEQFGEFMDDFNDVSMKEGQVLKFIENQSGDLPQKIEQLVSHREKLERFVEEDYLVISRMEELEKQVESIREKEREMQETESEINDSGIEKLEKEREDLEQQIEKILNSEEWNEKDEMENQVDQLEKDIEEINSKLSKQVSKIERPVKKIIYNVENEDLEFKGDLTKLKRLKNRRFKKLSDPDETLEKTETVLQEESITDSNKIKKFREASEELSNLGNKQRKIEEKKDRIEELENSLDRLDVSEKRDEVRKDLKSLNAKIESEKKKMEQKKQRKKEIEDEISSLESQLESELNSAFSFDIELV